GGGRVAPFSAGGAAGGNAAQLKRVTPQKVEIKMQKNTFALWVPRLKCPDLEELSLDTKTQKLKGPMIPEMGCDINRKVGDEKSHVPCWTCHRGSTQPELARPIPN